MSSEFGHELQVPPSSQCPGERHRRRAGVDEDRHAVGDQSRRDGPDPGLLAGPDARPLQQRLLLVGAKLHRTAMHPP